MLTKYSNTRYQECPWYVRLWRRRHYLPVPYRAVRIHISYRGVFPSFRDAWALSEGIAQGHMQWWYTHEEVFGVPQPGFEKDNDQENE